MLTLIYIFRRFPRTFKVLLLIALAALFSKALEQIVQPTTETQQNVHTRRSSR